MCGLKLIQFGGSLFKRKITELGARKVHVLSIAIDIRGRMTGGKSKWEERVL